MHDFILFLHFFRKYIASRVMMFGQQFERFKDLIVALLIVKRGKYSSSFLNTSFIIIVVTVIIGGPIIVENNPFNSSLDDTQIPFQNNVIAFDPFATPLTTTNSDKPRDKVLDHAVASGETLDSIGKRYGVSSNSIKWATGLMSDKIKTGQMLKIPPVSGVVHKVVSGDNIYSIAKKYRVDAQAIVNWPFNDFADLDTFQLTVGQTLIVPSGIIIDSTDERPVTISKAIAGVKGTSNFIWPASGIITTYPASYHMALDIADPSSPPLLASDTGTVVFAGCLKYGYGCHVIIDHGNGYQTLYGHMSYIGVTAGQVVSQGQQIGIMGSTGRSTGTHLHFEIRSGGTLLNPLSFLK